ncbi:hypothetical protein EV178_000360 [Coemansia sp. RSA 1646]|nr:hypothetical protein EV178_000360 [Coemansia sp. RSA 1646]
MKLLWTFVALTSSLASASYREYLASSAPALPAPSTLTEEVLSQVTGAPAVPVISTEMVMVPAPSADPGAGAYMANPPVAPAVPVASTSPVVDEELVVIEFVPITVQPGIAVDPIPTDINSVDESVEQSAPCSEETAHPSPMPSAPAPSGPRFTATMPAPPVSAPSEPAPSAPAPAEPSADSSVEGSSEIDIESDIPLCTEEESQYYPAPEPSAPAPSKPAPSVPAPSAPVPSVPPPSYSAPPAPYVPSTPAPSAPVTPAPAPAVPEPSSINGSAETPMEHDVTSCSEETTQAAGTATAQAPAVPAPETLVEPVILDTKTQEPEAITTTIFIDVTTDVIVTEILTATSAVKPAVPTTGAATMPQAPEAPIEVSIKETDESVDASSATSSAPSTSIATVESCVPVVSTTTVTVPVYLPYYPPFATEVWPNYSAIPPPFAPGPVIWTQGPSVPAPTGMHTLVPAPLQSSESCSNQ